MWLTFLIIVVVVSAASVAVLYKYGAFDPPKPIEVLVVATCHQDRTPAPPQQPVSPNYPVTPVSVPPYQGPGPHPIVLIDATEPYSVIGYESDRVANADVSPFIPKEWQTDRQKDARAKIQLVGCIYLDSTEPTGQVCSYVRGYRPPLGNTTEKPDFTVAQAHSKYTIQVYEAATGKLVTEQKVDGDTGCPAQLGYGKEHPLPAQASPGMSKDNMTNALRPLVEGTK
jgi:hypothetical protein